MLDHWLRTLQSSAFASWVQQSAYPYVITLHSIGLATLVGLLIVIDLRVLGVGKGLPLPALRRLMLIVWIGFWINAASGLFLFSIDAMKDFYSILFRLKLSAIAVGLTLGAIIKSTVLVDLGAGADTNVSRRAKWLAVASMACWTTAIVTGRLLAYFTFGDVEIQ